MQRTYRAVLKGDHVRWIDSAPVATEETQVEITLLEEKPRPTRSRGEEMGRALEELAQMGAFSEITDPVAWQREIRRDRPLPGREE
ncbi:MAG TPA: hypothetical protein VNP72_03900 [Longimicrobium sp.]|nr:hypothetical protein [Longimicrobium sp.]